MTDEEKQATLEAEEKAKADAKARADESTEEDEIIEEENSDEDDSEDEDKSKNTDIDYEAELKREREAREKAEKKLADRRFKTAEAKRKADGTEGDAGEDDVEDEDDKPLTPRRLQEILAKERQETQRTLQSARIAEIAKGLSSSEAEAKLIIEIHSNRTFPSHLSLEEQLEESYVIANRKKLLSERNEALRGLKNKDGVTRNAATTHQTPRTSGAEPKISAVDATAIKAAGFAWNGTSRQYEKKLSNGDILVRDSKTKQTRLVRKAK